MAADRPTSWNLIKEQITWVKRGVETPKDWWCSWATIYQLPKEKGSLFVLEKIFDSQAGPVTGHIFPSPDVNILSPLKRSLKEGEIQNDSERTTVPFTVISLGSFIEKQGIFEMSRPVTKQQLQYPCCIHKNTLWNFGAGTNRRELQEEKRCTTLQKELEWQRITNEENPDMCPPSNSSLHFSLVLFELQVFLILRFEGFSRYNCPSSPAPLYYGSLYLAGTLPKQSWTNNLLLIQFTLTL